MLSRRKDEGQNKISCRLLNRMAYLHRVSLQLELVAINIDVQVEIFILVALAIQEKATLWVPLAELGLEQLYACSKESSFRPIKDTESLDGVKTAAR